MKNHEELETAKISKLQIINFFFSLIGIFIIGPLLCIFTKILITKYPDYYAEIYKKKN